MSLKVPPTATPTNSGEAEWKRKVSNALNQLGTSVSASSSTIGILPMVDGSVPPVFIVNPDGSLIYTVV